MLELLRIRNLALIQDAEIEFAPGFNALTGETGAGKSFILRAVDFLTGERMSRDLVRPGAEKAQVEALFVTPEGEIVLRRELSAETGRSRVYVNDALSSQEAVRDLRDSLVVHTSQHGQQKLLSPSFQAEILDSFLPDQKALAERNRLLAGMQDLLARKKAIADRSAELERQREFLEYQKAEIDRVAPRAGEEEELEAARESFRRSDKTRAAQERVLDLLTGEAGLGEQAALLSRELSILAGMDPNLALEAETVEEFRLGLDDLQRKLRQRPGGPGNGCDGPYASLDAIESRLFELSRLKRKLNRDLPGILGLAAEVEENLSFLDACSLDLNQLAKDEADLAETLGALVTALNRARTEAAETLCRRLETELRDLGFSEHVRVDMAFEETEAYPGIREKKGRLLWVPNPGQQPQPLDRIASGGELSRFLLALVSLRTEGGQDKPSLLFDEVDAGIGGLVLGNLGDKLRQLAGRQQVLLITHWPQLAALADRHFRIGKEVEDGQTFTRCVRLDPGDIFGELSRMAGGGGKGDALAAQLVRPE